jgi:hypothetical protein
VSEGIIKMAKKKFDLKVITTKGNDGKKYEEKVIYIVSTMRFGYMYGNQRRSRDGIYRSYRKRTAKGQDKYMSIVSGRTWGWFISFREAQKSVLENWGDIYENEYSTALIEEVPEGSVINLPTRTYWYQWEGTWEGGEYVKVFEATAVPEEYNNVVSYWGSTVLKEEGRLEKKEKKVKGRGIRNTQEYLNKRFRMMDRLANSKSEKKK